MTRSFGASTSGRTRPVRRAPPPRRAHAFSRLGFTCYRLVAIDDRAPDEPAYAPVELCGTRNAMGAFMRLP